MSVRGLVNLVLIAAHHRLHPDVGGWKPGVEFDVFGTPVELQNVLRDGAARRDRLVAWLTPDEHREANGFTCEPIREVAILFAGIFVTIIPVLAMLDAGRNGAVAALIELITEGTAATRVAYFWLTGVLSAFLDNAPTYLVFFELAGGDARP